MDMGLPERVAVSVVRASGPALALKTVRWLRRSWNTVRKECYQALKEYSWDSHDELRFVRWDGMIRMDLLTAIQDAIQTSSSPSAVERHLQMDNLTVPSEDPHEMRRILWGAREAVMSFPLPTKKRTASKK